MNIVSAVSLGGAVCAVVAAVGSFLYIRSARNLRNDVLHIERAATQIAADQWPKSQALLNIFRFMELDNDALKHEPFSRCRLMSVPAYVRTLRIPGNFDWRRAVHTILVHFNLTMLLPAADLVVTKHGGDGGDDPFQPIGGSPFAYNVLKDAMSPLHLYAIGELSNLVASQAPVEEKDQCLTKMLDGDQAVPADLLSLPNPFIMSQHMEPLLKGLDPEAPPHTVRGEQAFDWLPDLADKQVGMLKKCNPYQERCSKILAILLNRLATNSLPDEWRPSSRHGQTQVQMNPESAPISSPEDLLAALLDEDGAQLHMQVVSRITGFGLGFAVKESDGWAQLPFVVPVRTGIVLMDGKAESSGQSEIMTLMMHAEVCLRLQLPGGKFFRMSWYQGIEGFTGWHPANEAVQPWNNSESMEMAHTSWSSRDEFVHAMRCTTCIGSAVNRSADRLNLPNGGYGFLGVCNDSVAMVQAGMGTAVTQFPCILAGQAKTVVGAAITEYARAAEARGATAIASSAHAIRKGMLQTPCDVVHRPSSMLGAIRRVQAGIPAKTPYIVLERARSDLQRAQQQLIDLDVGDEEELLHEQQRPLSYQA